MIREELGLHGDQKYLLIYDVFKAQTYAYVQVPPNLTHIFQPLDLNVNAFAKLFLKSRFQEWYAKEVTNGLDKRENVHQIDIDTKLSKMTPIHARWLISLYDKLQILAK